MELTSCERAFIQPNGCVTAGLEPWQVSFWWEWKWFPPKEWGWIQSSPYKLDAHFTSKLHPGNRKNKLDSTQEDIFLHHLIIWAWNHNACQMKKWWCRMWKSVVFRENIHGPGRLSHKVVSKLPLPKFWVTTKARFSGQISHHGFQLKIYELSLVPWNIKGCVYFPHCIPPVILIKIIWNLLVFLLPVIHFKPKEVSRP